MNHLGDLISALADGQLSPAETERALSHVTMCRLCARELDSARAARRALSSAADVVPDPALTARLMALQASIPPTDDDPLRRPFLGPDPLSAPVWQATAFDGGAGFDGRLDRPARRRRAARITALGVGGAGVLGLALFTLGEVPVVSPQLSAQTSMTMLGRTGPDATAAGQDVLATLDVAPDDVTSAALDWAADNGWAAPADLPDGYTVSAMRLVGDRGQTLEIDLTGPSGHAVVRERPGQLARDGAAGAEGVGEGVQVLATEPAHVAWQSADMVVDVVADAPEEVLAELVASFGEDGYDAGVLPRIARGWHTVTGAIESP